MTGWKGNSSRANPAGIAATISDELADLRHENVLFGDAVAQAFMLFAKSIQEGIS